MWWLLRALFAVLLVSGAQQSADDCVPKATLKIGLANQGGYVFNYQSRKGDGCRLYRVRNTPGHLLTPVLWEDENEIFLSPDLPECSRNSQDCGTWFETILTDVKPPKQGETSLKYGFNRDEYNDKPDAYRKGVSKQGTFAPLRTIMRGVLADSNHRPLRLEVSVTSLVSGNKPPYRFTYVIKVMGDFAFEILKPNAFPTSEERIGVIWNAAASPEFFEALQKSDLSKPPEQTRTVTVDGISAKSVSVVDQKEQVLVLLRGKNRLTAATAPAYRPER